MIFAHWRARRANRILIDQIHGKIVAAARRPALYADLGVPDTFDGRFEMVTLHAGLVMRRLMRQPEAGTALAHDLADGVFRHFEVALREMGLGDIAVAKRLKRMAEAFYGRSKAYGEALDEAAIGSPARGPGAQRLRRGGRRARAEGASPRPIRARDRRRARSDAARDFRRPETSSFRP